MNICSRFSVSRLRPLASSSMYLAFAGLLLAGSAGAQTCVGTSVSNGGFSAGLVTGSMPSASVDDWSALTATPQLIPDGCGTPGAVQMWGNQVVGESVMQQLPGSGFIAGRTYRVTVCYRWLDNNPSLPQYVRFRLSASGATPTAYPPTGGLDLIGITPNSSAMTWTSHTFPLWTAPSNASFLTINPENDETQNNGSFVSWGQIDDVCIEEVDCSFLQNPGFSSGLIEGSMPSASVDNWTAITATPQVVNEGCSTPGLIQMWGNQVVGESIQQSLSQTFIAGRKYRITVCYRWNNVPPNPVLPPYVRFRLSAKASAFTTYPPLDAAWPIGVTPNDFTGTWQTYTFPDWTAPGNLTHLAINPENDETMNHGDYVSWGRIDDICIQDLGCDVVSNGNFTDGLVLGSMPSASVNNWSLITNTPQVVDDGCNAPGALQMWGNKTVGESVQQQLPGAGIQAGRTYRVSVCYRWLNNNNPVLPQYVRFRLKAFSSAQASYPPSGFGDLIGITPTNFSGAWTSYTFPDWTASNNSTHLTINPENDEMLNHGDFVSWGQIDDLCITEVLGPDFHSYCNGDGGDLLGCTNCPCGNNAPIGTIGGCLNSSGTSARLLASGVPNVTTPADTLHFDVTGANPSTFGLLFSGADRLTNNPVNPCFFQNPGSGVQSPVLDGLRCAGANVIRHGARATDVSGGIGFQNAGWGPPNAPLVGLGVVNAFASGQTRHFQVFYRELPSLGCFTGQNTTNAISVTFQ